VTERMRLSELVSTGLHLGETRGRKAKIRALAALLASAPPREAGLAAVYLAGILPQGKIGLGYAKVYATVGLPPAATPSLTLAEADDTFTRISEDAGPGSAGRKAEAWPSCWPGPPPPSKTSCAGWWWGSSGRGRWRG
jgi:DNA ligase-1